MVVLQMVRHKPEVIPEPCDHLVGSCIDALHMDQGAPVVQSRSRIMVYTKKTHF